MIYLYVLIAITVPESQVAKPASQTLSYHAMISTCIEERNRVEKTIDSGLIRLDCVPVRVR